MAGPDVQPDGSLGESDDSWQHDDDRGQQSRLATSTLWIRCRAWLMMVPRLVGLGLLLLGAYNLIGAAVTDTSVLAVYRVIGMLDHEGMIAIHLGDVVVSAAGAAVIWATT